MLNKKTLEQRTFIVGGYVRDLKLGLNPLDKDIVIEDSSHEEMIANGYKLVGKSFGVYIKNGVDAALCRRDIKNGVGYKGFECEFDNVSIKHDRYRSDLTINSMAIDYNNNLIDYYGGLQDIEDKVLRHVSEAFSEDPLRVVRLARFSARFPEFTIAEETKELAKSLRDELRYIHPQRIFKELEKVLNDTRPSIFFRTLLDLNALDILFPEIYNMIGLEQKSRHHAEGDVFEHTMRVLDEATKQTNDPIIRFGSLFHDLGKIFTKGNFGEYHGHCSEEILEREFDRMKKRLNIPNKYIEFGLKVAVLHHKVREIYKMSHRGIYRMITSKYFPKNVEELDKLIIAINSDTFGRINADTDEQIKLSKFKIFEVFENRTGVFEGINLNIPDKGLDKEILSSLVKIRNMKIKIPKDYNSNQIKNLIIKKKQFEIKNLLSK